MFYHPDSKTRFSISGHRRALFYFLCITSMAVASPAGNAVVLFSENFENATDGQLWSAYPGWSGQEIDRAWTLVVAHGQNMGKVDYPSMTLTAGLNETYSLSNHGYRLAFDMSGHVNRSLLVYFGDSENNRVGLQVGYISQNYAIGGASQSKSQSLGSRVHYNPATGSYGGYHSTAAAPADFNINALYHATVDINGTSSDLEIGGVLLAAGKVRITYNDGNLGGMDTFTTIFDIPVEFQNISTIQVTKANTGGGDWYIGNFEMTSYQAIPEPSTVAALVSGGVLLTLGAFRRRR